ncbi:MAG: hypothetical protein KVP17_002556 [Porospora cf. gigantea B]|uniref:uncharacterized protein n=1 Tax=Porospora cf. gigantea B TaxID=2853592 RepID=UPI003571C7C5|nr:MAG: hypothetical protein KVP17_002556 [Porospora cf. gigantea B]
MPAMTEVNLSNHNDRTLGPATRTVDSHYVGPSSTWPPNRPAGFVASGAYPDPYEAGSRPNENSRYGAYPDPYEAGSRPNENSRYEKDKITREQVAQLMGLRSQYSPQCRGDWVLQAFQRR